MIMKLFENMIYTFGNKDDEGVITLDELRELRLIKTDILI